MKQGIRGITKKNLYDFKFRRSPNVNNPAPFTAPHSHYSEFPVVPSSEFRVSLPSPVSPAASPYPLINTSASNPSSVRRFH